MSVSESANPSLVESPEVWLVMATFPDEKVAVDVASRAVEKGLVACVNVLPSCLSIYQWQGRVERQQEILVIFKTLKDRYEAVQNFVCEQHPYDVPELIAIPVVQGSSDYLSWVANSCSWPEMS